MCGIEDETAVVVVASYCSVSRNLFRFKAVIDTGLKPDFHSHISPIADDIFRQ